MDDDWEQQEGFLYFQGRLYVPSTLRNQVLRACHDQPTSGHMGIERSCDLVTRDYFWPGQTVAMRSWVQRCQSCDQAKHFTHKAHGLLQPLPVPEGRWTRVGADFITGLPTSNGYDAIGVMIDALTKMVHFVPCSHKGLTAEKFANMLRTSVIKLHGIPKTLVTDRGTQFVNQTFKDICTKFGIQHFPSTAYHPRTDGQTERVNQPLEAYLRHYVNYLQDDWADWLDLAESSYNNSKHSTTGMTPFYACNGYHPSFDLRGELGGEPITDITAAQYAETATQIEDLLKASLAKRRETMGKYFDQHRQPKTFQPGDRVLLDARNIRSRRPSAKLDMKNLGPFEVLEAIGDNAYKLALPATLPIHPVFHVELLHQANTDERPAEQPEYESLFELDTDDIEWEVEGLVDVQFDEDSQLWMYQVHWKGDQWEDTWEPAHQLLCPTLITAFHIACPDKPRPPTDAYKPRPATPEFDSDTDTEPEEND